MNVDHIVLSSIVHNISQMSPIRVKNRTKLSPTIAMNNGEGWVSLVLVHSISNVAFYLFIYLFIQYFQRVAPLASLASLPSGPL